MRVAHLDRGHAGKPTPHHLDRGAVSASGTESDLVSQYIDTARVRALQRGVAPLSPSLPATYRDRMEQANQTARSTPNLTHRYVACHLNAGGGGYGLVGYDTRSILGRQFAHELAAALHDACPWLDRVAVVAVGPNSAGWQRNVWHTIRHIYEGPANICAVCYEPGFVDVPQHVTPDALHAYGRVLAEVAAL